MSGGAHRSDEGGMLAYEPIVIRFVYQGHVLGDSAPSWGLVVAMPEDRGSTFGNSTAFARGALGLCVSPRRGQCDVTVLHRLLIALHHDRPRLLVVTVVRH